MNSKPSQPSVSVNTFIHHSADTISPRMHKPLHEAPTSGLEFARGALASFTTVLATFPLNKLMSRQIYEGFSFSASAKTLIEDGIFNLYRGVLPPLMQKGLSMGIMYGSYDFYYHGLFNFFRGKQDLRAATDVVDDVSRHESTWQIRAIAAMLSGCTEALLTPFERIQTILQHRPFQQEFKNTAHVAMRLYHMGWREYYRGFTAVIVRNAPSSALFFLLRDPVRETVLRSDKPSILADFLAGAVLGASISTLFYPLNHAKGIMQLQIGGKGASFLQTLVRSYRESNGFGRIYNGVYTNAVRSLLSWGIVNASYEVYKKLI
jgi:Mitochondrial carrier protein